MYDSSNEEINAGQDDSDEKEEKDSEGEIERDMSEEDDSDDAEMVRIKTRNSSYEILLKKFFFPFAFLSKNCLSCCSREWKHRKTRKKNEKGENGKS